MSAIGKVKEKCFGVQSSVWVKASKLDPEEQELDVYKQMFKKSDK